MNLDDLREIWRRADAAHNTPWFQAVRKRSLAHSRVHQAVAKGILVRGDCAHEDETCRGQIEGHHDDYDKPLEVVWLCVKHHHQLHTERRREQVAA